MIRYLLPAILTVTQAEAVNLIVNGQFEDPFTSVAPVTSYASIPGWSPLGSAVGVSVAPENPGIGNWPTMGQGGSGQFVDIGNASGTGIAQTITVPVGFGPMLISWYDATLSTGVDFSTYNVRLLDSSNGIVASGGFLTNSDSWALKTLMPGGLPAAGSYTLEFEPTSGAFQKDTLIDNVSVVPEPSSSLLVGIALGLCLLRRNRR